MLSLLKRLTDRRVVCIHKWGLQEAPNTALSLWSRSKQGNLPTYPFVRSCTKCGHGQVFHSGLNNGLGEWVDLIAPINQETFSARAVRLYGEEQMARAAQERAAAQASNPPQA